MYKLEITLKQHTPLIHFQHDQEGATLRATEVKPKLDRFILMRLGRGDYEKGKEEAKRNNWLIGVKADDKIEKDKQYALNYKIRIIPIEKPYSQRINYKKTNGKWRPDFPFIFGNVETIEEQKVFRVCNVQNLEIRFYNEQLKNEISNSIYSFFAKTNFGFRQNKGFGSFFPSCKVENSKKIDITIDDFKKALKEDNSISIFTKKYNLTNYSVDNAKELFKQLDREYKILKSGINESSKRNGTPSKLREYFYDKYLLVWDKESIIKRRIVDNGRYLRFLLGLADHFEYTNKKMNVDIEHVHTDEKNKIERFQSPLTFKIYENNVYIIYPKLLDNRILNQTFKFTINDVRNESQPEKIKELKLSSIKTSDNISPNFYYEFLKEKLKEWKTL